MEGKVVIISAPSGAGKTSIVTYLLKMNPELEFSISATTRKPRNNEINGRDYYFISIADFKSLIKRKKFVEWEEVYKDQYYGTLKSEIKRIWSHNKHVLFDVDVRGGINLKKLFGEKAISIFIMPPSVSELEKRLLARGTDDMNKIKVRIGKAVEEIELANEFDSIVVNDNLDMAQREVNEMVNSFLKK